jgi:tetratricopeptide (TPR) repeat protein
MGSWAVMIALSVPGFGAATLATATADLQAGKADEAKALLTELLRSDGNNAEANNLLCRVEFTVQEFDAAAGHCERAVSLSPEVSRYHLWLGRALGERASRASFLSAFSLAKRTRAEFERAVELNPKDAEALTDLGEFYEEAPGAVGGGMDKARALAAKLDAVDMARGHDYRGSLAEHEKDLGTAEREYRAGIQGAAHPAFQWMALASFLRRHERWQEMEAAVESGAKAAAVDRHAAVALFNGATTLERTNRRTDLAIRMLTEYVASPEKTEEAPAFDAWTRLAKLKKKMGDAAGAEHDRSEALGLAREYKPALEALK